MKKKQIPHNSIHCPFWSGKKCRQEHAFIYIVSSLTGRARHCFLNRLSEKQQYPTVVRTKPPEIGPGKQSLRVSGLAPT